MGTAENLETVRRFYGAGPAADDRGRAAFATPDIIWHVPGENRVSRDYRGADDVFRAMGEAMAPLDRWDIEIVDVMANRDLVMATVEIHAERLGRRVTSRGGHVFRLTDDGRIAEAWGFVVEQRALDALLDPLP
jgi:ketosteroid isomerase-like protein